MNMLKIPLSLAFAFAIIATAALAQSTFLADFEKSAEKIEGQKIPGAFATLLGNQRINVYITLNETVNGRNPIVIGITTQKKTITQIGAAAVEKPTVIIHTDERTIRDIMNSPTPIKAVRKALIEKKIRYSTVGLANRIRAQSASVILKLT